MSASKDYLSLPLREFLDDTAAKSPTPGGGSVAAVVGQLATSLARMSLEFTVGKPKYAAQEAKLRDLLTELQRAGDMFVQLMSEDMAAYERYAASRKSSDPQEQQRAIATAVAVPMEIVVLAGAVAARLDEVKACVNPNLMGDLQTAAILAEAAAVSGSMHVRENLRGLTDRKEAGRLENQLDMLLGRAARHRDAVVSYQPAANP